MGWPDHPLKLRRWFGHSTKVLFWGWSNHSRSPGVVWKSSKNDFQGSQTRSLARGGGLATPRKQFSGWMNQPSNFFFSLVEGNLDMDISNKNFARESQVHKFSSF